MKIKTFGSKLASPILFLHGFPGDENKQNQDIAKAFAATKRWRAYVLHYSGLGKDKGIFGFRKSIDEALEAAGEIAKNHKKPIAIFGHSWGGFVAIQLLIRNPAIVENTILLAPLLQLPTKAEATMIIEAVLKSRPHLFGRKSLNAALIDLEKLKKTTRPRRLKNILKSPKFNIWTLLAERDEVLPIEDKQIFKLIDKSRCTILSENHVFNLNRERTLNVIQTIVEKMLS